MLVQKAHPLGLLILEKRVALDVQPGGQVLSANPLMSHPVQPGMGFHQASARWPEPGQVGKGKSVAIRGLLYLHAKGTT
jgi:hypothetical protein